METDGANNRRQIESDQAVEAMDTQDCKYFHNFPVEDVEGSLQFKYFAMNSIRGPIHPVL